MRLTLLILVITLLISCNSNENGKLVQHQYHDIDTSSSSNDYILAMTNEEYLQMGSDITFVDLLGDTVIPFGKYKYCLSDTLKQFAMVMSLTDGVYRKFAINRDENVLFDLVFFDNGPEVFHEGLLRVKRNEKIGYANKYGQVVIPCQYECGWWFKNGMAKVAKECTRFEGDCVHKGPESDEWVFINKKGEEIKPFEFPENGEYIMDIVFAEWQGRSMGDKVKVVVRDKQVKVTYISGTLSGTKKGDLLGEGILMTHKSGVLIIGESEEDINAEEVGGCTDGPIIIDFYRLKFEFC